VLLCPTVPFTAPPLGTHTPDMPMPELVDFTQRIAGYTAIASLCGWCAMSVPLFRSAADQLPIGMHFAMPQGRDDALLELAFQLEDIRPWLPRVK
jgi:amidase